MSKPTTVLFLLSLFHMILFAESDVRLTKIISDYGFSKSIEKKKAIFLFFPKDNSSIQLKQICEATRIIQSYPDFVSLILLKNKLEGNFPCSFNSKNIRVIKDINDIQKDFQLSTCCSEMFIMKNSNFSGRLTLSDFLSASKKILYKINFQSSGKKNFQSLGEFLTINSKGELYKLNNYFFPNSFIIFSTNLCDSCKSKEVLANIRTCKKENLTICLIGKYSAMDLTNYQTFLNLRYELVCILDKDIVDVSEMLDAQLFSYCGIKFDRKGNPGQKIFSYDDLKRKDFFDAF